MKNIILTLIIIYQKTLSPDHGIFSWFIWSHKCRFYPTCSQYIYQAVENYGVVKGGLLGIRRLLKCHPWHEGGYDPVIKVK